MPEEAPAVEEATQEAPESGLQESEAPAPDSQESPAVDWDSDDNPYKQRYSDLRPQSDRAQSVIDALSNPETQAEALERWFGIKLEEEEGDDEFDTDEPLTRAEFQNWQAEQQQREQALAAQEQELDSDAQSIDKDLDEIEKQHGKLSNEELDILLPVAVQNRREDGTPAFKEAFDRLFGVVETRHEAYRKSKRAPKVATGTAGTDKIDVTDPDALEQAMAETMAAHEEAEG